MFSAFKKSIPQISIFHNSSSPPSAKALAALRSATSSPYPPGKSNARPLKFNLEVLENTPPTPDQIRTILTYLPPARSADDPSDPHHVARLISTHPSAPSLPDRPSSAEGLSRLAQSNPHAVRWPIIVDWTNGKAVAGDSEGVKDILEHLRKRRDGEIKEEADHKPTGWFS
ncbi:hypothetical protein BV25DRAFT_1807833 [Artomyces pyxidatus]|uniref:Uncharacterized protein n=1 Tax=Artomyces pyxidatus TaxID=48021 RepID=A0ACB8SVA1_9AGAM|nr:hypothetical protein BV25DRAFT_1807833 [Artomyces pyxidatus]